MTVISRGRWRFHSVKSTSGLTSDDDVMAMGFWETKCALRCSAEGEHQLVDGTCFISMRISK